jgi:hypothetical protein
MTPDKTNENIHEPLPKLPNLINIKSEVIDEKKSHSMSKKSLKKNNFGKRKSKDATAMTVNKSLALASEETKSEKNPSVADQSSNPIQNSKIDPEIELNIEDI